MSNDFQTLVALFGQGRLVEAEQLARKMTRRNQNSGMAWKALSVAIKLQGRTAEALEPMKIAAARLPADPEASNNLGTTFRELGQLAEAEASYRRAVQIKPDYAEGHYNLAILLNDLGRHQEAEAACRQAIRIRPGYVEAYNILGVTLKAMGKAEEAVASFKRALDLNPHYLEAYNNLGSAFNALGRLDEAKAAFSKALQLRPDFAEASNNLGATLFDQGLLEEAEKSYRQALKYRPDYAQAHYNLGIVLHEMGRVTEAIESYRRGIENLAGYLECYNNLALSLNYLGRCQEAEATLQQALALDANHADLLNTLGLTLHNLNRPQEAEIALRRALEIKPDYLEALVNLGLVLIELGRPAEAEASFRTAIALDPGNHKLYQGLLFSMNYLAGRKAADQVKDARSFGALASRLAGTPFTSWQAAPRSERLRVGLVSGDFRNHPVGYFLEGLLSHLDPSRIELFAYSCNHFDDELTGRIRPFFSSWRELAGRSDAAAAELIHRDGVHVLLDLSGHTASNRLTMFARRPAPVQASWLGYSGTTGLAEMDYLLADRQVVPAGSEDQFTEKLWRLPESYLCLTPPPSAPEVGPLPRDAAGFITFGSFNNLAKMNDETVAVWARILTGVPGSRLFLMTKLLNDQGVCEAVRRRFAEAGVGSERLILEGTSSRELVLAGYGRVDIALDTFPYTGTTTSAEALWMGVPVLTRRGDSFLSRVGESILTSVGLSGWIASDDADYVAKAVGFAGDPQLLAALRSRLRDQAQGSPLFDIGRFARNFEAALWGMWNEKLKQMESGAGGTA
ncbi:MAG TPA: tetratricopeptide repeat protein [Geomonas sp.]|nr:tetratricopeptide repeat protein [Geomonas sp.]